LRRLGFRRTTAEEIVLVKDANDVEKLYDYGERLNEDKEKSNHESDYIRIIAAAKGSSKAKHSQHSQHIKQPV